MPDIGVAHGKRSGYARILPALPERANQRLQPEVEPRAGNEPGRGRRAAGAALSRGTVASTVRESRGQQGNQVRAPAAGSLQLLSPRERDSVLVAPARSADTGRTEKPLRAHAFFRRSRGGAIKLAALDEAGASACETTPEAARDKGNALCAFAVRGGGAI